MGDISHSDRIGDLFQTQFVLIDEFQDAAEAAPGAVFAGGDPELADSLSASAF